jgi:hypothetical protein
VNARGCEGPRTAVSAKVYFPTEIVSVQNGSSCGDGVVTLTASGAQDGDKFAWYDAENAVTALSVQNSPSFITPVLSAPKTFYVSLVNANGCEGTRKPVSAIIEKPVQATISIDGQKLVSNYSAGNQWYLDGIAIAGATGQTFEVQKSGIYSLKVTVGNCSTSAEREFAVTDLEGKSGEAVTMFPNPVAQDLVISTRQSGPISVSVINSLGIRVQQEEFSNGEGSNMLSVRNLATGLYYVYVSDGRNLYKKKIIKK